MSNLIKLKHEEYDEFWLDLDHIVSVGLGVAMVQQAPGVMAPMRGTVVALTSGQKLMFPSETYDTLLKAKLDTENKPPKDIDIPEAFLKGWQDPKGDLDTA